MTFLDRFVGGRDPIALLIQAGSAAVAGVALAWTYYGMRAVLDVGGTCAEGGPYVVRVECPDGTWMMALGIPVMTLTIIVATMIAASSETPLPVFPMWAALFGSLGWNFLDYGIGDPPEAGWIVCGVVFWLMAAPAALIVGRSLLPRPDDEPGSLQVRVGWVLLYLVLGASGWVLGWTSFQAWS